jgi:hypothetical protein
VALVERRYGICRTVWLVGPWAIKTPRLRGALSPEGAGVSWTIPRAVLANQSEREWSGVEGVAPVLRSLLGGLVNVYPRCEPWPADTPEPDYDQIGDGWLPRDRKPENVGLLDGQPVWLDYDGSWNGCPHDRNAAGLTMDDDD